MLSSVACLYMCSFVSELNLGRSDPFLLDALHHNTPIDQDYLKELSRETKQTTANTLEYKALPVKTTIKCLLFPAVLLVSAGSIIYTAVMWPALN